MSTQPKKKVLYLITKSNWGGAQRYVYDLATHLNPLEFEPVVAMGGDGALAEMLHHSGIRVITLEKLQNSLSPTQAWRGFLEIRRILRTEKPAVFHVNSSVAGFIGTIAGRLTRTRRIIFTAHGWAFNEDRPYPIRLLFKLIHYLTVRFSHRTIAVSNAIVMQMNWPGVREKMTVINPGRTIGAMFDHDEARGRLIDFVPALNPYKDDTWVVCLAELHPIKRHIILFEAVAKLVFTYPKLRVVCIGDGKLRATLEAWVTEHALGNHIFVVGSILEAARYYKAFDICVLASKSESYGYVLHEAGLSGVPVIATAVGGIPDIITSGATGLLIPPDSVEALEDALAYYLDIPNPRLTHAKHLKASLTNRTVDAMTKKTVALYISKY